MPTAPYPVKTFADHYEITVGGKVYRIGFDGSGGSSIPVSALTVMGTYLDSVFPWDDKGTKWIKGASKNEIATNYAQQLDNSAAATVPGVNPDGSIIANPDTLPVVGSTIGTVENATKGISDLVTALFDPNVWLRIVEFLLGAGLLYVGASHLAKGNK